MDWSESGPISRDENVEIESMCTVVLENKLCIKYVRILRSNGKMLVDKIKRNINTYINAYENTFITLLRGYVMEEFSNNKSTCKAIC